MIKKMIKTEFRAKNPGLLWGKSGVKLANLQFFLPETQPQTLKRKVRRTLSKLQRRAKKTRLNVVFDSHSFHPIISDSSARNFNIFMDLIYLFFQLRAVANQICILG